MTIAFYNKLVRDLVVDQARARGLTVKSHRIDDDTQYVAELAKKLVEEAGEFQESLSIEELADVAEVCRALVAELSTPEHFAIITTTKAAIRGAFVERIYLESIEDDR